MRIHKEEDIDVISKGVFYNENKKVLLLKVTNDVVYDLPGGHLHFGESIEQGLYRECFEETGLKVKKAVKMGESERKKVRHFFFVDKWLGDEIVLQLEEVSKYKWINVEDYKKYNLTKAAEEGLEMAQEYINLNNL
tara:strand:+ start:1174 stop:1581 length:408 start_codon:yes stop_codon:yes gene_type:complete